jgi:hypothetical protein
VFALRDLYLLDVLNDMCFVQLGIGDPQLESIERSNALLFGLVDQILAVFHRVVRCDIMRRCRYLLFALVTSDGVLLWPPFRLI